MSSSARTGSELRVKVGSFLVPVTRRVMTQSRRTAVATKSMAGSSSKGSRNSKTARSISNWHPEPDVPVTLEAHRTEEPLDLIGSHQPQGLGTIVDDNLGACQIVLDPQVVLARQSQIKPKPVGARVVRSLATSLGRGCDRSPRSTPSSMGLA